jgi:hypothetical protein
VLAPVLVEGFVLMLVLARVRCRWSRRPSNLPGRLRGHGHRHNADNPDGHEHLTST